jgi:hypothetical protein
MMFRVAKLDRGSDARWSSGSIPPGVSSGTVSPGPIGIAKLLPGLPWVGTVTGLKAWLARQFGQDTRFGVLHSPHEIPLDCLFSASPGMCDVGAFTTAGGPLRRSESGLRSARQLQAGSGFEIFQAPREPSVRGHDSASRTRELLASIRRFQRRQNRFRNLGHHVDGWIHHLGHFVYHRCS